MLFFRADNAGPKRVARNSISARAFLRKSEVGRFGRGAEGHLQGPPGQIAAGLRLIRAGQPFGGQNARSRAVPRLALDGYPIISFNASASAAARLPCVDWFQQFPGDVNFSHRQQQRCVIDPFRFRAGSAAFRKLGQGLQHVARPIGIQGGGERLLLISAEFQFVGVKNCRVVESPLNCADGVNSRGDFWGLAGCSDGLLAALHQGCALSVGQRHLAIQQGQRCAAILRNDQVKLGAAYGSR